MGKQITSWRRVPLLMAVGMVFIFRGAWAQPGEAGPDWVEFDYEHYATEVPYRIHVVDSSQNAGIMQAIPLPGKVSDLFGIQVKVSKTGEPGDLRYSLGTTRRGREIASGSISAGRVIALYDLFYQDDFKKAVRVPSGGWLYLTLEAESGSYPEDYYLVYGPKEGQGRPTNAEGSLIKADGKPSFPISYRLMTSPGSRPGEDRHQFVRDITAPPYSDADSLIDPSRSVQAGEVHVTSGWRIVGPPEGQIVIDTAIEDLKRFFERRMGLTLSVLRRDSPERLAQNLRNVIVVGDTASLPRVEDGPNGSESYRVNVESDRIVLQGADDRGAMRAIYYLEDVMSLAGGPYVKQGEVTRSALYSPRLTTRFAQGSTFLTELSQPNIYTDGFLWRLSHQGFNAIFLYGNLEELTQESTVFPELNHVRIPRRFGSEVFPEVLDARATERRYERLRDLVDRGRKYGIDVYLYYASNYHHPVPMSFYEKYPDAQGYSWGNSMCTSNGQVQEYLAETTRHVFESVPGLKGLVAIFDSEGFFSCAVGKREECARCRDRRPEDIVAEYLNLINRSMREVRQDGELIVWSYFTSHPQWVFDMIPKLDSDITFQGNFDKGTIVERGSVRHVSGDYLISELGPPDHFVRQAKAAIANGMKVSAKTCHSYANEFVSVPYIPIPFQFYRRMARIGEYPVQALLANWSHHGYSPSLNAEVFKWYSWDNAPEIDVLLTQMAGLQFGKPAAPSFVEAWRHFSTAITHYPYSDPVGRYPGPIQVGPAHPLLLSPFDLGGGKTRDWQNDLEWTKPWGPELLLESFGRLEAEWKLGVDLMAKGLERVPPNKLKAARREFGIANAILCSVRSIMNVVEFFQAREDLNSKTDPQEIDRAISRIREIATRELANARRGLAFCEADSRIGYASGGARVGGLYTPALIRRKIAQVETMLSEDLPRMFPRNGTAEGPAGAGTGN